MQTVTSRDGTSIAYDKAGQGPAVILVDGAMCYRAYGPMPKLAPLLARHFTVFTYDRRGRGDSGNTKPYAAERELEDLEALIDEAGGSACVYGISSGAVLALDAANALGDKVRKLALYEAPLIVDDSRLPLPEDFLLRLEALIAANRRSDAVKMFLKAVGMPAFLIPLMPFTPGWSKGTAVAHTLVHDFTLLRGCQRGTPLPAGRWSSVTVPTLVAVGGKSPAWMQRGNQAMADLLPQVQQRTLPGQTHMLKAEAIAPVLVEFFGSSAPRAAEAGSPAAVGR
jgi:pimeloyl-ACP methyl ester carboxylesterase